MSRAGGPCLSPQEAEAELEQAAWLNPGPWVAHSRNVARAVRLMASATGAWDPDRAYVGGLLHDIGRRYGFTYLRHVTDGHRYLAARDPGAARVCLTHSFPLADLGAYQGELDVTPDDLAFLESFLSGVRYDFLDLAVQIADTMADHRGFVPMEVRWDDVARRYGTNALTGEKRRRTRLAVDSINQNYGIDVEALLLG